MLLLWSKLWWICESGAAWKEYQSNKVFPKHYHLHLLPCSNSHCVSRWECHMSRTHIEVHKIESLVRLRINLVELYNRSTRMWGDVCDIVSTSAIIFGGNTGVPGIQDLPCQSGVIQNWEIAFSWVVRSCLMRKIPGIYGRDQSLLGYLHGVPAKAALLWYTEANSIHHL